MSTSIDLPRFENTVRKLYTASPFSVEEVIAIFEYYFLMYSMYRGEEHPPLRAGQVLDIMKRMPFVDVGGGADVELIPEQYPGMIARYFNTRFPGCDYRINHFFSGRVREMRMWEGM